MVAFDFVDQRGVKQEVTLNVKKGIEAKSYEGVSIPFILKQKSSF